MLSSILQTLLLSFHFNLFCMHPSFISIASNFLFRLALHFSSFHFIPISLYMLVCVCVYVCVWVFVCVAAGCLWLFFRQQPRRLDCHNLWSWVISVSNQNLRTGPFFLYSSSTPPPPPLFFSLPFLPSLTLSSIACHHSSPSIVCRNHNWSFCYWSPPMDTCHLSQFLVYH